MRPVQPRPSRREPGSSRIAARAGSITAMPGEMPRKDGENTSAPDSWRTLRRGRAVSSVSRSPSGVARNRNSSSGVHPGRTRGPSRIYTNKSRSIDNDEPQLISNGSEIAEPPDLLLHLPE